ncbi:gas vesicle protein [Pimelobacter simplex]|uniref:Putative gas vesicle synthesis protein n=1 Tax=Nocardioides simplex TaxID=2045 RepID=A0A0A1DLN7_NOCSI|nr:gas vesicle protein [Pimelobacter simplex]AIY17463.1 putative gas vesicle synthesis protein [Pimelobacter simplex]MCG8149823.1 gas vesicle protein [Pimelobacter simplex]GEB13968.1 gas vesicle protein [Pimelobacter simplex]SFM65767.1 Gas vesicle synthesis protein GvpO [Pimelobacter simplex]
MAETEGTPRRSAASEQRARRPARLSGPRAAARGAQQLAELTGRELEGVVGLSDDGDGEGWTVQVEVVEIRRIPGTTDVLAVYEVDLDRSGDLLGYRRVDRYTRGAAGEKWR